MSSTRVSNRIIPPSEQRNGPTHTHLHRRCARGASEIRQQPSRSRGMPACQAEADLGARCLVAMDHLRLPRAHDLPGPPCGLSGQPWSLKTRECRKLTPASCCQSTWTTSGFVDRVIRALMMVSKGSMVLRAVCTSTLQSSHAEAQPSCSENAHRTSTAREET